VGDYFSFPRLIGVFPKVLSKFPVTLLMVVFALVIGVVLGIVIAIIRVLRVPVLTEITTVYISFFRSTPEIIQLFLVYFGAPAIAEGLLHINLDSVGAVNFAIVAFGLNQSAFLSELFRGGLESVPNGQYEAAYAAGLTTVQTFLRVVIPQAVRIVLPGFGVEVIGLFQGTSIASTIGVIDMMGKAQTLGIATSHSLEAYTSAAALFVVISIVLELAFRRLSQRFSYERR
jgi:L-cystine transport system permease protein